MTEGAKALGSLVLGGRGQQEASSEGHDGAQVLRSCEGTLSCYLEQHTWDGSRGQPLADFPLAGLWWPLESGLRGHRWGWGWWPQSGQAMAASVSGYGHMPLGNPSMLWRGRGKGCCVSLCASDRPTWADLGGWHPVPEALLPPQGLRGSGQEAGGNAGSIPVSWLLCSRQWEDFRA